jgi:hypothetical protein
MSKQVGKHVLHVERRPARPVLHGACGRVRRQAQLTDDADGRATRARSTSERSAGVAIQAPRRTRSMS